MINFPNSPVNGQLVVVGNTVYQWNSSRNRWLIFSVTPNTVGSGSVSCQPTTSTGYFDLPVGTTAQRQIVLASGGNSIYSTSTGLFAGTSIVHAFISTGTSYFTATNNISSVAYLVVAGGGSGGSNN